MAKTIPIKNKSVKKKINYSKIAIELKGKVSFNIDLRKTDKNPSIKKGNSSFSRGEKSALTKAAREYSKYNDNANYVPIKRESKESRKSYKLRLRQSRRDMGQQSGFFKGVWIDIPKGVSDIKTKRKRNNQGKWTTEIISKTKGDRIPVAIGYAKRIKTEIFIPIDPIAFSVGGKKILMEMIRDIKKQYPQADYINPVHSGFRGTGTGTDKKSLQKFSSKILRWSYQYAPPEKNNPDYKQLKSKSEHWLSGFLVGWYELIPEIGAKLHKNLIRKGYKL